MNLSSALLLAGAGDPDPAAPPESVEAWAEFGAKMGGPEARAAMGAEQWAMALAREWQLHRAVQRALGDLPAGGGIAHLVAVAEAVWLPTVGALQPLGDCRPEAVVALQFPPYLPLPAARWEAARRLLKERRAPAGRTLLARVWEGTGTSAWSSDTVLALTARDLTLIGAVAAGHQ